MAIITIVGSGMMGSAIGMPAADNGNEVRMVGTPLDREIIAHGQKTQEHLTLRHDVNGKKVSFVMPRQVTFHYYEELQECMKGADLLICGVSSFGLVQTIFRAAISFMLVFTYSAKPPAAVMPISCMFAQ